MKFLRTVSTRRLLALIAGLIAAIAAGTTLAVAAAGNGPVPKPTPLARAIHDALAAPALSGISARISFTNHLFDSSEIQGSDPLLSGATGRLWLSGDRRLRLELQGDNGDAQLVVDNGSFWVYDPTSNTVYEGQLPRELGKRGSKGAQDSLPSIAQIEADLTRVMRHVDLSGAIPSDVAGQAAYTLRFSPKHGGGLLGAAEVAWDAIHGVPLRFALYARGDSSPVLELTATDISFGPVSASDFAVSPPSDARVVRVSTPEGSGQAADHWLRSTRKAPEGVTGVAAVARHMTFPLVAPSTLAGLPRRSARLLDWDGSPAALIAYGQDLGGVAVIEQVARSSQNQLQPPSGDHAGLSLPTVSINGTSAQELDTALGSLVRFTRTGVTYTVVGSVPGSVADAAARAL